MSKEDDAQWVLAALYAEHLVVDDAEARLIDVVNAGRAALARVRKMKKRDCVCEEGEPVPDDPEARQPHDHPDKDERIETEAGNVRQLEYAAEQVGTHRDDLMSRAGKAKERAVKLGVPLG